MNVVGHNHIFVNCNIRKPFWKQKQVLLYDTSNFRQLITFEYILRIIFYTAKIL